LDLIHTHRQGRTVFALEVLPGGVVAAARDDGTVTLWDTVNDPKAEHPTTLEDHGGFVLALARLGDRHLVAGDQAGQVTRWDTTTGRREGREKLHDGPVRALTTRGTTEVFSGGQDGRVMAWDVDTGSIGWPPGQARVVASGSAGRSWEHRTGVMVIVAPTMDTLLFGRQDGTIGNWDITDWKSSGRRDGAPASSAPTSSRRAVTVLVANEPDIVAADHHAVVRVAPSGAVAGILINHSDVVHGVAIGPGEVFSCSRDGTLRARPRTDDEHPSSILVEGAAPLRCLAAMPPGGDFSVVAAGADGVVHAAHIDGRAVCTRPRPSGP
jgi:WD40 repeat protein